MVAVRAGVGEGAAVGEGAGVGVAAGLGATAVGPGDGVSDGASTPGVGSMDVLADGTTPVALLEAVDVGLALGCAQAATTSATRIKADDRYRTIFKTLRSDSDPPPACSLPARGASAIRHEMTRVSTTRTADLMTSGTCADRLHAAILMAKVIEDPRGHACERWMLMDQRR